MPRFIFIPLPAASSMATAICPVVRSCYEMALKGAYDFMEGMVMPHACDSMCITHDIWRSTLKLPYFHLLNIPHGLNEDALEFYVNSLRTFRTSLERYRGGTISDEAITSEIGKYNTLRSSVRYLYELRRNGSFWLSGSEVVRTLVAAMSLPVEEATSLVQGVSEEATGRTPGLSPVTPKIMITGSEQDDDGFCRIIEECGAAVVSDFLCPGRREDRQDVAATADPLLALAARYLNIHCARTYRESHGTTQDDLEERFGPIRELVKDYGVQGVIIRVHRYCDPYGLEVPALRNFLQSLGVLVLYLEDDYLLRDPGRFRNRIQAFVEMLRQRREERTAPHA